MSNNPIHHSDPTGHMQESDHLTNKGSNCHGQFAKYCNNGKPLPRDVLELRSEDRSNHPSACEGVVRSLVCKDQFELPPDYALPTSTHDLSSTSPTLEMWTWITRNGLQFIDYLSAYEDIINSGTPLYRQVKWAFGTGGLEALSDASLYGLQDRWSTSLTPDQRVGRMIVVGVQSYAVDRLSEKVGLLGVPLGKAGEVGVQYLFSGLVSKLVLPTTTKWTFNALNLGVPQDLVVHFP